MRSSLSTTSASTTQSELRLRLVWWTMSPGSCLRLSVLVTLVSRFLPLLHSASLLFGSSVIEDANCGDVASQAHLSKVRSGGAQGASKPCLPPMYQRVP